MREGVFELLLLVDGEPVETVEIQGQVYAVARPGSEYTVKVNIYPKKPGVFGFRYLRLGLFIDGVDVNYWKRVDFTALSDTPKSKDEPISVFFYGFSKTQTEMTSFVFATPSPPSSSSSSNLSTTENSSLGNIVLVVYEADVSSGTHANVSKSVTLSDTSVNDDTKLWRRPSVTTTAGKSLVGKETFQPLGKWINKSKTPMKSITLKYHTKEMLNVLQHLSKDFSFKEDDSKKRKLEEMKNNASADQDFSFRGLEGQSIKLNNDIVCVPVVKEIPMLDLTTIDDDESTAGLQWTTVKKTMF